MHSGLEGCPAVIVLKSAVVDECTVALCTVIVVSAVLDEYIVMS